MDEFSHITDIRLKAYLASLNGSAVALRRVTAKLGKKLSQAQKIEDTDRANFDKKGSSIKAANKGLNTCNRERHLVRCEARATHLLRQFLKGKSYKAAEQKTRKQTFSVDRVIIRYLPEDLYKKDYDLQMKLIAWSKEA